MKRRWHVSLPSSGTERVTRFASIQAGSMRKEAGFAGSSAAANSPNARFSTTGGFTPFATRMYGLSPGPSTRSGSFAGTNGRISRSKAPRRLLLVEEGPEVSVVDDPQAARRPRGRRAARSSRSAPPGPRRRCAPIGLRTRACRPPEPPHDGAARAEHPLPSSERVDHVAADPRRGGRGRPRAGSRRRRRSGSRTAARGSSMTSPPAPKERVSQRVSPATTTADPSPRTVRTCARKSRGSPPGVQARK